MQIHFWDRLYKSVLKPILGRKINCARKIFSILLIFKVLKKINLYFILFAIVPAS